MAIKIKKFEFTNLKSFVGKYEITFNNGLNVISGHNGSGKSSILEGVNATLGYISENSTKLISKDKECAKFKITFNDGTNIILIILREPVGKFKNMYFINDTYTDIEKVINLSKQLDIKIIDNFDSNLDHIELKKSINNLKNETDSQYIVSGLRECVIEAADKVINVERLKQCKIV